MYIKLRKVFVHTLLNHPVYRKTVWYEILLKNEYLFWTAGFALKFV